MITAPAPRTQSSATLNLRCADPLDVEKREREDRVDVPRDRVAVVGSIVAELVPRRARNPAVDERAHRRRPRRASRKSPLGPMNLSAFHSIGLWLAVIIEPAGGVMVLDGELAGRRRRQADVDHVAADRLARR